MLNEIMEAEGYLYDLNDRNYQFKRIKSNIFSRISRKEPELNGLGRFMTTVARYFLFKDGGDGVRNIKLAETALIMWCGLAEDDSLKGAKSEYQYLKKHYPWVDGWLPAYLREDAESRYEKKPETKIRQNVEASIEKIKDRREAYSNVAFSDTSLANDYRQITFERAVANALASWGPLRKYYIVCEDKDWTDKLNRKRGTNEFANPMPKDYDKILKLTADILLQRNRV